MARRALGGAIDRTGQSKDTLKPVFNDPSESVTDAKKTGRSLISIRDPMDPNRYQKKMYGIKTLNVWRAG